MNIIFSVSIKNHRIINTISFEFPITGNGMMHSLSWHRKGDRIAGCKLFARIWTPEDPRTLTKFSTKFDFAADHTQI